MARRRLPSPKAFERHPGVYAKTTDTYTTRYYRRKTDPLFNLLGLHTSPDDFHKSEGSSPFLRNVRYMGEREADQRAQVMSRKGARVMSTVGEDVIPKVEAAGDTYIEVRPNRAIEYELQHNKLLTGLSYHIYNKDQASGHLKVTVRDFDTKRELSNAVIDGGQMSTFQFLEHTVRFIKSVVDTRVLVRLELMDEGFDRDEDSAPRAIRILADREGKHQYADYELPNLNESLQEVPFEWIDGQGVPLTGITINDWETIPRSHEVKSGGRRYLIFPVKHDGMIELYKTDLISHATSLVTNRVDDRAKAVRFDQAEGFLYYVDGYSNYQRINLTNWSVEDVVPKLAEIDGNAAVTDPTAQANLIKGLTAKPGASLIKFAGNRMYLSGFADDPNLVLVSLIDSIKPRFDQFNDRFYSPDQSPELSAGNPITALESMSDYIIVWRLNDLSLYTAGSGYEAGGTSQITPEGAALGVLNQEAVCKGKNNVYFFNPIEGVVRFAGSVNRNVSVDIENVIKGIRHPEAVFMLYQNKRVHMFFSLTSTKPDSRLFYYTELEGRLPWYQDNNTPVSSAVAAKDSERIYAVHSQVATVMELDVQFSDFDSYIEMEYHTQYRLPSTADPSGETIVRRIHVHEIANATHSLYIGLDTDHQDRPTVWRAKVEASVDDVPNPDAVFQHAAEPGNSVISIPCYIRAQRYQVRIKRYCYRATAEVMGASVEYDSKEAI